MVINKKSGVVVHPAPGNYSGTLVNGLMYLSKDLSHVNGEFRPGIVHRIDKDTSGLLIVAKNDKAHRILAEELKAETIFKKEEVTQWVCRKCGHIHIGKEAPCQCPVCEHPQAYFQVFVEMY